MTEERWIDLSCVGSPFDVQIDVNSRHDRQRHRPRSYSNEIEYEWVDGAAPRKEDE